MKRNIERNVTKKQHRVVAMMVSLQLQKNDHRTFQCAFIIIIIIYG